MDHDISLPIKHRKHCVKNQNQSHHRLVKRTGTWCPCGEMFSSSSVGVKPAPAHVTKKSIVYEIIRQGVESEPSGICEPSFKHSQKGASEGTIKAKHFLAFIAAKAGCGETSDSQPMSPHPWFSYLKIPFFHP